MFRSLLLIVSADDCNLVNFLQCSCPNRTNIFTPANTCADVIEPSICVYHAELLVPKFCTSNTTIHSSNTTDQMP